MDPKKAAAEWFRTMVFKEESLRPRVRPAQNAERLPPILRAARALANNSLPGWQSAESLFLKQGKLLANYEDNYDGDCGEVLRYYTTYQSLTDRQLRAYFSWRTRLRRGELQKTSLSFAFLYIYELINQIGVTDQLDGYRKLEWFRDAYGQLDGQILSYLEQWMTDYVVYYNLDPSLLADSPLGTEEKCAAVLEHIRERSEAEVAGVLRQLSSWLRRSKFYGSCQEDMDRVMVRVLRKISAHCARRKRTMVDQYFGGFREEYTTLFSNAVFCDPMMRKNYTYSLGEQCVYECVSGTWYVSRRMSDPLARGKLEDLLKAIDSAMRVAYTCGGPLKYKLKTKWILQTIEEEIQALLAEKRAAEEKKITIDYRQLTKIRRDASITQEKLIVEEDLDPMEEPARCVGRGALTPPDTNRVTVIETGRDEASRPTDDAVTARLNPEESRLLRCLLYGGGLDWVQREGLLLSVLADSINEKLYDTFQDSVLDDTPCLFEDYIDDLKEMIRP